MMAKINILGEKFEIETIYKGRGEGHPYIEDDETRCIVDVFEIKIKKGNIEKIIDYYKVVDEDKKEGDIDIRDILSSFTAFICDAHAGKIKDFKKFCIELGITDKEEGKEVYKKCKKALQDCIEFGIENKIEKIERELIEIDMEGLIVCSGCGQEICICGRKDYVVMDLDGNIVIHEV